MGDSRIAGLGGGVGGFFILGRLKVPAAGRGGGSKAEGARNFRFIIGILNFCSLLGWISQPRKFYKGCALNPWGR